MHYRSITTMFLFLCLCCYGKAQDRSKRPNVLLIAIDDLRPDLGVYGNSVVQSPNIDAIGREGIIFKNHYVNVPTCGASRHSFITGMRPRSTADLANTATEHALSRKPEPETAESFIHLFKQNGYQTVGIGKITHSADGYNYGYLEEKSDKKELPHSWSELIFNPGKWETGWNAFFGYADGSDRNHLDKQVPPFEHADVADSGYPDGLTAELAVQKLGELAQSETPFLLGVGFFKPHLPFNAPQKYWDLYDESAIELAPFREVPANVNQASLNTNGEFNQYALGKEQAKLEEPLSDAYAREVMHGYYASISYIDAQVGKLVGELKRLGLYENTIIVIWGDHGWHLGDQNMWGKHTLFESALKSAFIIKCPQQKHSEAIETIVETVDIYPTLAELAGLPMSDSLDGESLVPYLLKPSLDETQVAYSYFRQGISMRTEDYRITKYFRDAEPTIELYDHRTDPNESKNIAAENPEIVQELMLLLENGNTGLYDN